MMGRWNYWYFAFKAEDKERQWCETDSTVIAAKGDLFPIQKMYEYAIREFGKGVKLTVLSAIQISEADYGYMVNLVGGEDEDEPETDL